MAGYSVRENFSHSNKSNWSLSANQSVKWLVPQLASHPRTQLISQPTSCQSKTKLSNPYTGHSSWWFSLWEEKLTRHFGLCKCLVQGIPWPSILLEAYPVHYKAEETRLQWKYTEDSMLQYQRDFMFAFFTRSACCNTEEISCLPSSLEVHCRQYRRVFTFAFFTRSAYDHGIRNKGTNVFTAVFFSYTLSV